MILRYFAAVLKIVVLGSLALMAFLWAFNQPVNMRDSQSRSVRTFTDQTAANTLTYRVRENMDAASLDLLIEANEGTVEWTLADPNGTVVWDGKAVAGQKVDDGRHFTPVAGEWTLTIDLVGASGRYEAEWRAT